MKKEGIKNVIAAAGIVTAGCVSDSNREVTPLKPWTAEISQESTEKLPGVTIYIPKIPKQYPQLQLSEAVLRTRLQAVYNEKDIHALVQKSENLYLVLDVLERLDDMITFSEEGLSLARLNAEDGKDLAFKVGELNRIKSLILEHRHNTLAMQRVSILLREDQDLGGIASILKYTDNTADGFEYPQQK